MPHTPLSSPTSISSGVSSNHALGICAQVESLADSGSAMATWAARLSAWLSLSSAAAIQKQKQHVHHVVHSSPALIMAARCHSFRVDGDVLFPCVRLGGRHSSAFPR
eukprot:scaffold153_cov347-Pavlova_lutheri.AAC.36